MTMEFISLNNGKEKKVANFVCCNLNSFGFIAVFVKKWKKDGQWYFLGHGFLFWLILVCYAGALILIL